jgi:opacity protein-like surface antigen
LSFRSLMLPLVPVLPMLLILAASASPVPAQPSSTEISLFGGASYPGGDFDKLDDPHNGFILGGSYGIYWSNRIEMGLLVLHNGFKAEDIILEGTVIHDRRFILVQGGLFGKFLFLTRETTPYAKVSLGGYRWAERRHYRNTTGSPIILPGPFVEDGTDFGFALGGGVQVKVGDHTGLFAEGMWHRVGRTDLHDWRYFDLLAGLTFYLGGE